MIPEMVLKRLSTGETTFVRDLDRTLRIRPAVNSGYLRRVDMILDSLADDTLINRARVLRTALKKQRHLQSVRRDLRRRGYVLLSKRSAG